MQRRFTTTVITEQSTEDDNLAVDRERLHDQIIDAVQSDDYGTMVVALQTVVETLDPETKVFIVD